jgi:recombinational DNA repair protein (RecF pathway)
MRQTIIELGIIIRVTKVGENDARITLFTAAGVTYATVRGVYRPKARFASSIGLFTVAEFAVSGQTVTGINVLLSPYGITADIHRYYLACAIADALLRLEFVEACPAVLVSSIDALTELSAGIKSCYPIFIDYFSGLLDVLGYAADINYDKDNLSRPEAKKLVQEIISAFAANVDYNIPFCEDF